MKRKLSDKILISAAIAGFISTGIGIVALIKYKDAIEKQRKNTLIRYKELKK